MKEIASAVSALLAFLVPLGIYCMLLAFINRRHKPLMVRGTWDALGLLAAISGFLLWTLPILFDEFCRRVFDALEGPYLYSAIWTTYLLALALLGVMALYFRATKTVIYNVDTAIFRTILEQSLARLGLGVQDHLGRLIIMPVKPAAVENAISAEPARPAPVGGDHRHAELSVENFYAMCHVTLHWHSVAPHVRREIEEQLERGLEMAAPEENPAAGWFYSISGLIFGALFMVAMMILFIILFPKH